MSIHACIGGGHAGPPGPAAMTIRAWRPHGARSNNAGTPFEPESPRKGSSRGTLDTLHHRCVGCEIQGRPGGRDGQIEQHSRWGNRRRGTRRREAAAALERTAWPTAAPAVVPAAVRQAVRRDRRSSRCSHAQHGAAANEQACDRRRRHDRRQRRAARCRGRRAQRSGERGAKRARGSASPRDRCAKEKTGRAATGATARPARVARPTRRPSSRGCRAGARGRRGSR